HEGGGPEPRGSTRPHHPSCGVGSIHSSASCSSVAPGGCLMVRQRGSGSLHRGAVVESVGSGTTDESELPTWDDVQPLLGDNLSLLVGNGLSSNLWPAFTYGALLDKAREIGGLQAEDEALF